MNFSSPLFSANARIDLNEADVLGQRIKCFFFQVSSGPSCSKLTTSLVNVSLKFQTLILQIHCYFLLKKCKNPLQRILTFFQQKVTVYLLL